MLDIQGLTNPQAEFAILGTAVADPGCAISVAGMPEDIFTAPAAKAIHAGLQKLVADRRQVDVVSLSDASRTESMRCAMSQARRYPC